MSASSLLPAIDGKTMLVGNPQALKESFPDEADQILQLVIVPELDQAASETVAADLRGRRLSEQIIQHRPEQLLIVGGDGTINLAAEALLECSNRIRCILVPAGTANDLAGTLETYTSRTADLRRNKTAPPAEATQLQSQPGYEPRTLFGNLSETGLSDSILIDVIRVRLNNEHRIRCCTNMFTLGAGARNMHCVTTEVKERWGAFAYLSQFWQTLSDLVPQSITMRVGQSEPIRIGKLLNAFVANGPTCGGRFRVAPEAEIDDGLFNVILLREGTVAELTALTAAFLAGVHLAHELVEHFTARRILIDSTTPIAMTLDGERAEAKRAELEIVPRFLEIRLWRS